MLNSILFLLLFITMTQIKYNKLLNQDLKALLASFNQLDQHAKGYLSSTQILSILQNILPIRQISIKDNQYYTFDDFLSILSIYQTPQQPSSYVLAFIKMLVQYQKKSQLCSQFQEAQKTILRIMQIKQRQLNRRKNLLKQKQKNEKEKIQKIEQQQSRQFNENWNRHLQQFEQNSYQSLEFLKKKHLEELEKEQNQLRNVTSMPKYSKKLIDLINKQKTLIKIRNYNEVMKARRSINQVQYEQHKKQQQIFQLSIERKLKFLRKQQKIQIQILKSKITNQRAQLLIKKQQDSKCILQRIKNLKKDLKKKFQQEEKQLNQHIKIQFNTNLHFNLPIKSK